jgi:hypothetical protein
MAVVTDARGIPAAAAARPSSSRLSALLAPPRLVIESLSCVLLPLVAPALIAAYIVGAYKPDPFTVDGQYFRDGGFLFDLHVMWDAGHDVVTGVSPYPFVYPAPAAFLMAPFGALPWTLAVIAFTAALIAALVLALRLLGVGDWRCYAVALAWLPMSSSITIGTLSPLLALAAAVAWRYRDRRFIVAAAIVGVVVTKIFLWPLFFWLLATRRFRTAATTVVLGVAVTVVSWAALGFDGLRDYGHGIERIAGLVQERSYSLFALFRLLGGSTPSARAAVAALTLIALGAIFALARGTDGDRRSFVLALGVGLIASPIVWMHYLVLLVVPLALYRPRFGAAWLVPLTYWILLSQENEGSAGRIAVMYGITALSLALAMWPRREREPMPALNSPVGLAGSEVG